jgi:manganese-dependent inorganic pyrophosphatase
VQTIVIGHRNPDMDSICSAIGYARLKQLLGVPDVVAARAGNTNARIDYVLDRFGVEAPVFLSDVAPRVSDVMQREAVAVKAEATVYDAIQLIEERQLRGLPVTDEGNRCLGLLSAFKLSHHLFPPREEATTARIIVASLADILRAFGGRVVTGQAPDQPQEQLLMVGAMNADSFSARLHHQPAQTIVLFVGDRDDIQMRAIEAKVRAIVVTGGLPVLRGIQRAADQAQVTILSSSHDTATTVLLARGAVRVGRMVEPEFISFAPDTPLDAARDRVAASTALVFPILAPDGTLAGVLTKSDFIKPAPRQLILVDHNELSQAVGGADKVPIVEILDHHRLGGFASESPIHFWNNPVGSTSTLVALCYQQLGVAVPSDIAGLLMAGLVADTLNLTSPTATPVDRQMLGHLAKIAQTDPGQLAEDMFSVGSPLLTLTPDEAILADCKEYTHGSRRFTVAQIEELTFAHLAEKQAGLLAALERHAHQRGLCFAALLVTDINSQNSLLLASGEERLLGRIHFPARGPNVWELAGVVSRKKQLLPYLLQCLAPPTAN